MRTLRFWILFLGWFEKVRVTTRKRNRRTVREAQARPRAASKTDRPYSSLRAFSTIPIPDRRSVRKLRADELAAGRTVLHRIHADRDSIARLKCGRTPTLTRERIRTSTFDAPLFLDAVAVLHVDLNPDVRVLPLELLNRSREFLDLLIVEHGGRMMPERALSDEAHSTDNDDYSDDPF